MAGYVVSPDALQDLQDIWDFIAFDNTQAADHLEDEFFKAFGMLARQPRMGHTRLDLTKRDVRFWTVSSYLIVYRQLAGKIEIVALLHGSRDIPKVMRSREYPPG